MSKKKNNGSHWQDIGQTRRRKRGRSWPGNGAKCRRTSKDSVLPDWGLSHTAEGSYTVYGAVSERG